MGLIGSVKRQVQAVLPLLFEDEDLVTYVTYRKMVGHERDEELKSSEPVYRDTKNVPALTDRVLSEHPSGLPATAAGVELEENRSSYMFRASDLPSNDPQLRDLTTRDKIIENGEEMNIVSVEPIIGLLAEVICEKHRADRWT